MIDPLFHKEHTQEEIVSNIQHKKYKAVIYGSIHRGNMLLDIVSQYYKPIVLCGEDSHHCPFKNKNFTFFLREFE
jgi:DNA-binding LacI/PurR family transcriptional regulator